MSSEKTAPEDETPVGRTRPALDLQRDLPVTPEDVEALRRLRYPRPSPEAYRRFMERIGHASIEELRRRKGPRGKPFEL